MEWGQEATGQVEKKVSTVPLLCLPVIFLPSPGSLSSVLVGSWRGEGLRSASYDASAQAQAPLPGRESGGRERVYGSCFILV